MKTQKKQKYVKPEVKKINLDAKCAVLGFCKLSGSHGPGGSGCNAPVGCNSLGS